MSNVQRLKEMFEKNNKGGSNGAKPLTPTEFAEAQKKAAEKEAKSVLEARRKAATYNMTVRAMQLKMYTSPVTSPSSVASGSTSTPPAKKSPSAAAATASTATASAAQTSVAGPSPVTSPSHASTTPANQNSNNVNKKESIGSTPVAYDKKKMEIREKARKYSIALTEEVKDGQNKASEILQQKERRATQVLLKSLTADVEKQIAEELAAEKERVEKERAEKAAAEKLEKDKQQAEDQKKKDNEVNMIALAEEENNRVVLTSFLKENHPDRLGEVETLLKEYKGHLDVLFEELAKAEMQKSQKESSQAVSASATSTSSSSSTSSAPIEEQYFLPIDVDPKIKDDLSFMQKDAEVSSTSPGTAASQTATESEVKKPAQKYLDDYVNVEQMLNKFYSVYAPQKVPDIPKVLVHFEGREKDLIHTLEIKYNVTFMTNGTCTPNDASSIGESFLIPMNLSEDVQKMAQLKHKLSFIPE